MVGYGTLILRKMRKVPPLSVYVVFDRDEHNSEHELNVTS